MAHAQEVYNQAKHTLTYFSFQKQRLEDLMSQMAERLEAVEGSLSDLTEATSPEDIGTVKVRCYCIIDHLSLFCCVTTSQQLNNTQQ